MIQGAPRQDEVGCRREAEEEEEATISIKVKNSDDE